MSDLAKALRGIADLIERNEADGVRQPFFYVSVAEPEDLKALAIAAGTSFAKQADEYSASLRACNGMLCLSIDRNKVCRKVKRMKLVEEYECDSFFEGVAQEAVESIQE